MIFSSTFRRSARGRALAFTLIEILAATSVLVVIVALLASMLNQALGAWSRGESKSDLRESARTAINLIGSELRQAVLPVYRADPGGLQMVINPSGVSAQFRNRDAIFWQAPIASSRSKGDLAIIGYFVRHDGNTWKLCRYFLNPDDPSYKLHGGSDPWVSDTLLDQAAPATEASNLQGLFLENVPAMWVTAYSDAATKMSAYDSRVAGKFPARVEISLALLDATGAQRVADGIVTLPDASSYDDPEAYLAALPKPFRAHVQTVTINVPFLD